MTIHRILLAFFFLSLIYVACGEKSYNVVTLVGNYNPIKDVNDQYFQEIAKYAVSEHNKESKDNLKFVKIIKGETQVSVGRNYRLTIATDDSKKYEVVVYDQPWQRYRKLSSFKSV
ncbi:cysteine proteinase inhibitor 1-like [Amaranthus tricolor]|uniref:cysteine proteinase inhibitor 1-like n=1 Tax=Amaranthus tricolor TaxID=29722 RepID=UPI0025881955|nr:cysteine proteinase inhibitor 1-like [Amaranthus tricolor]